MSKLKILFAMLLKGHFVYGQKSQLSIFNNLTGKTWKAEDNWENGASFKQEIVFAFALDTSIIITNSKGYVNQDQTKYGLRNHGIRKFDRKSNYFREYRV